MKAIITKYRGPTDTRGARIKVSSAGDSSLYVPYRCSLSNEGAHHHAARQYMIKKEWRDAETVGLVCGSTVDGFAFLVVPKHIIKKEGE